MATATAIRHSSMSVREQQHNHHHHTEADEDDDDDGDVLEEHDDDDGAQAAAEVSPSAVEEMTASGIENIPPLPHIPHTSSADYEQQQHQPQQQNVQIMQQTQQPVQTTNKEPPVGLSLSASRSPSPPSPTARMEGAIIDPPSFSMSTSASGTVGRGVAAEIRGGKVVSNDAMSAAMEAAASSVVDASLLPRRLLHAGGHLTSGSMQHQQQQVNHLPNTNATTFTQSAAQLEAKVATVPQLEARVLQLEQNLESLTELCQSLLLQQQQSQHLAVHSREGSEVAGYNASGDSSPNTPRRNEHDDSDPHLLSQWSSESPDGSMRQLRHRWNNRSSSSGMSSTSSIGRGRKGLSHKNKTMSMVLLDIKPGESRGPSMIPFTSDLDACDEMDGDSVAGGCRDQSRKQSRNVRGRHNISGGNNNRRSGSFDSSSRSCGSVEKKESSLRGSTCTDDGANSSSDESSRRHQDRALRRLSSSMKAPTSQPESNLECQAYTIEHLKALRLRAGKGRAYSFNDSLNNPAPPKQYTHVMELFDGSVGEPDSAISAGTSGSIFVDVSARDGGNKDENEGLDMPDLSLPDKSTTSESNSCHEIIESLPRTELKSVGTSTVTGGGKNMPHSTSCASNMSSDTSKTLKSGNTDEHQLLASKLRAGSVSSNSATSNKERSQSISSQKSTGSTAELAKDTVGNAASLTSALKTTTPSKTPQKQRASKGKSPHKHATEATPKVANKGKSPRKKSSHEEQQQQQPQTMKEYVINDLLNIDSRNQDGSATEDIDANMEEFLRVPSKLENLLVFSLAVCVDSFLYAWAMLPLKFVWGWICLICSTLSLGRGIQGVKFHRRHLYPMMQSLLIYFVYTQILCPISIGKLYHWIRGQAMLKLYVLIAIVEVFDRLLCSFGQDAWDSLYWNTTRRPRHPRMFVSIIVVGVYVAIHSLFLFVHVATLSVAVNSADNALLTLLISGNFAEIKSTVFKKYNKQNLFKITTSDICERFKLALFLLLILFLNRFQGEMTTSMVKDYYSMCGIIFAAELICDWIKHSFITKFNLIKSSTYFDYALVLSGDVTGIGHEGLNLDCTHAAVKRLGLAQIPLVCVTARYLHEAVRFAIAFQGNGDVDHPVAALVDLVAGGNKWKFYSGLIQGMAALVLFKIVLGMCIRYVARGYLGGSSATLVNAGSSRKGSTNNTPRESDSKKKQ